MHNNKHLCLIKRERLKSGIVREKFDVLGGIRLNHSNIQENHQIIFTFVNI